MPTNTVEAFGQQQPPKATVKSCFSCFPKLPITAPRVTAASGRGWIVVSLPAFLTKSRLFTAVPRCYPLTSYLFPSQPSRSHARQAQGKKERGSFLPFTMETALYPKDCECPAAVSLPPLPRLQRPPEPLTPHPGSRLSAQQVTANLPSTDLG